MPSVGSASLISDADNDVRVMNHAIESGSNEVYVINAETLRIERANKAARDNLGYTADELRGMSIAKIAPANRDPELMAEHREQLRFARCASTKERAKSRK